MRALTARQKALDLLKLADGWGSEERATEDG